MKYVVIIFFLTLKSLANSASITSRECSQYKEDPSPNLEIQCYNFKNILHFNVSLTDDIRTIKLIRNSITALDSSSFPNRSKSIKRLFLNMNQIKELPPGTFKSFPNLEVLDLTGNYLTKLDADVFVDNKQLREIYLDDNNFENLNLDTFRNLAKLKRVTLENNHLESCKPGTLITLNHFRRNGIVTDVPNLCSNQNSLDLLNVPEVSFMITERVDLKEESHGSVKTFIYDTLHLSKKRTYFLESFLITFTAVLGVLSIIYIIHRNKKQKGKRTRKSSENPLIGEDEESGYLTPKAFSSSPTYLEVFSELDNTSKKSENNFAKSIKYNNYKVQPIVHKTYNVYEEVKLPQENIYSKIWK